jgi:hypothetical protein
MSERDRDSSGKNEGGEEIKVTDRRKFTPTGERRGDIAADAEDEAPAARSAATTTVGAQPAAGADFERRALDEPEGVDFTMLVNAMAQPALLFLGEIADPATGQAALDLEQARLQIDMLGLLGIKCRGNLAPHEEKLLERVLYQLRMLYVARSSRTG